MPGYTSGLRALFTSQLQRAGYTVVVDRSMPHDLVALIQGDWPSPHPGVATMLLTHDEVVVAELSVSIPIIGDPPREFVEGDAAVALVAAMGRSESLAAFAVELNRWRRRELSPSVIAGD